MSRMVELLVRQHPEDPFFHDERLAQLFRAIKWAGELWLDPQKRPQLPDWCEYYGDTLDIAERLVMEDGFVGYQTMSGKGIYKFWPDGFIFQGTWQSLLDGCPLCHIIPIGPPAPLREDGYAYPEDQPPVTPRNAERVDVYVYAPVGPCGLQVHYGGFYYPEFSEEYVEEDLCFFDGIIGI